jgi:hypothetical protein
MTILTEAEARATTDALYEWIARYVTMENNTEGAKVTRGSLEEAYREFHLMWEVVEKEFVDARRSRPHDPERVLAANESAVIAMNAATVDVFAGATDTAAALIYAAAWPDRATATSTPTGNTASDFYVSLTLDQLLEYERIARKS